MFRVLSLDGGGIKGAFTASVLATLEEDTGRAAVDHFDLIKLLLAASSLSGLAWGFPRERFAISTVRRGRRSSLGPALYSAPRACIPMQPCGKRW
jgi:hypothetical protein